MRQQHTAFSTEVDDTAAQQQHLLNKRETEVKTTTNSSTLRSAQRSPVQQQRGIRTLGIRTTTRIIVFIQR